MSGFVLGFVFYLSHVTSIPAGDLQKKGILGISDYYRCASIFESLKTACFAPRYRYAFHRYMLRIGAGGPMGPIMPKTRRQGSGMIHAHPPMDRKSVVEGKSMSVRVELGGR